MVRPVRLELTAPRLKGGCSTTELRALKNQSKEFSGFNQVRVKPNTFIILKFSRVHKIFIFHPVRRFPVMIYYNTFFTNTSKISSHRLPKLFDNPRPACYHITKGVLPLVLFCEVLSMKKIINSASAPEAIGPYSQAVEHGGLVFTSGVLPVDPVTGEIYSGDVQVQTELILNNLENILKEAGCTLKNVVKTTVYMTDLTKFAEMNATYETFFKENPPARSTLQVVALPKGSVVEIEAIAKK